MTFDNPLVEITATPPTTKDAPEMYTYLPNKVHPGLIPSTNIVGMVTVGVMVLVFGCFAVISFARSGSRCPRIWSFGPAVQLPTQAEDSEVQEIYLARSGEEQVRREATCNHEPRQLRKSEALSKIDCKIFNVLDNTVEETSTDNNFSVAGSRSTVMTDAGMGEFSARIEVEVRPTRKVRFKDIPEMSRQISDPGNPKNAALAYGHFNRSISLEDPNHPSRPPMRENNRLAFPDGIRIYAHQNMAFDEAEDGSEKSYVTQESPQKIEVDRGGNDQVLVSMAESHGTEGSTQDPIGSRDGVFMD